MTCLIAKSFTGKEPSHLMAPYLTEPGYQSQERLIHKTLIPNFKSSGINGNSAPIYERPLHSARSQVFHEKQFYRAKEK